MGGSRRQRWGSPGRGLQCRTGVEERRREVAEVQWQ
uniref:Uncharacterized protein n=1 Tax=Arundo donax TaxID=35708 RepID=A0A0A9AA87_ARUDO